MKKMNEWVNPHQAREVLWNEMNGNEDLEFEFCKGLLLSFTMIIISGWTDSEYLLLRSGEITILISRTQYKLC